MFKGLIIDLDGVITKDKNLNIFDEAPEFIKFLMEKGIKFCIATNNSMYTPEQIIDILKKQNVFLKEDEILTPLVVLPDYLEKEKIKDLFVIGNENLKNFLKDKGFIIKEDHHVGAVIVGIDKNITFEKLKIAVSALKLNNAKVLSLNANLIVKDDDNLYFPGVGCIGQMIACSTKKEWNHLGKNSAPYNELLLAKFKNISPNQIAVLSDDIFTDLIPFSKLGIKTIFITTGKYKLEDLPDNFKPDIIANSLKEVKHKIENFEKN